MRSKLIGGILLVSGTTIGAGMLALPVSTGMAGAIPSVVLFAFFWLYMTCTALLLLEVNLKAGDGENLMSMAKTTLGLGGQVMSWIVYLFLLYSLTTAYVAGSGAIVVKAVKDAFGLTLPGWIGALPLLIIFGYFVHIGTHAVDKINRLLMVGLSVAYAMLAIFLIPHVDAGLLTNSQPQFLFLGVSVVATSFGFHIIIPSLVKYLDRNVANLKFVIIVGSFLPFVVYSVWQLLALGIIPREGANSISEGYAQGSNGASLIAGLLGRSTLSIVSVLFSFFAIITSFLGVSLSLSHFLADGLKIKEENGQGRLLLLALTFVPPFLITLIDPRAFLSGLEYAGAFGVVVLLGLLPALMAWRTRYALAYSTSFESYRVPGGKPLLLVIIVFSIVLIGFEIALKMGMLSFESALFQ